MRTCKLESGIASTGSVALAVLFLATFHVSGADVLQTIHSFGMSGPDSPLMQASDGNLYGTSSTGGANGAGSVFRITTNGSLTILHSFTGGEDGANPFGGLIQASDGNFYGTTSEELTGGAGTVFRMSSQGILTTLYSFTGLEDGSDPTTLTQASDGNLYGTTFIDGAGGNGTIFRVTTNGTLTTLYSFTGNWDGANPLGMLVQARDGKLYGTTAYGGNGDLGTVFRITLGGAFALIHQFNGTNDGAKPLAGLVQASDGGLYGTAALGGPGGKDYGTVFRISTNGAFTRIHAFTGGNGGEHPTGQLARAGDDSLYGTTQFGGLAGYGSVFRLDTNGTFVNYHSFTGSGGSGPLGGLVLATDGNLYGTTVGGGASDDGTAFRMTPVGGFTLLQSFPTGYSGIAPVTGLTVARNGRLYGTTVGGIQNRGTIFSIGTDSTFTPLHSFAGGAGDGDSPRGSLLAASDGNLYGTTELGGANGAGTVYRVTQDGVFTLLHSFSGGSGGAHLWSGLVQGRDGHLYGTTGDGGANGMGTAFRMTLSGALTTIYSFTASIGGGPRAALIQASDGAFYGTSQSGGTSGGGTVYRLTTNGAFALLHAFSSGTNDYYPDAPLVQAVDGSLYGTTAFGGAGDAGTIFRISTSGAFSTIHTFDGYDGNRPSDALVQAIDGNLYGTTYGSLDNHGTVFRITTNGTFTLLYSFTADDGGGPSGVVQADDGNLYGTTYRGGFFSEGTVFRVLIAPLVFQAPSLSGGKCIFSFQTVVRQRYTIETRPDFASANWAVYTTLNGDGSLYRLVVPIDYYSEQYFRIRKP